MVALRGRFPLHFIKAAVMSAILMDLLSFAILMNAVWSKVSWYTIYTDVEMSLIELPFTLLLVVVLASGPAWLIFVLASRWRLDGPGFYGVMGLLTAALAATLFTLFVRAALGTLDDDGNYIPFVVSWGRISWAALPSGVCGGLVFAWSSKDKSNDREDLIRLFE